MKIPAPRRLKNGTWFIQLRLGGESISVSDANKSACVRKAQLIKSEYLMGKRIYAPAADLTLSSAIDQMIEAKQNTLSPLTVRGYRIIQKYRFQSVMQRSLKKISSDDWQLIINAESALCSPKTLKNAWGLVKSVLAHNGISVPSVNLPALSAPQKSFLSASEIPLLVKAVAGTKYAIPVLLCLSSLRISELQALRWENIDPASDFIRVSGAVVLDEKNHWQQKAQNKTLSSARNVPILIPELKAALAAQKKSSGPVMEISQNAFRVALHKICASAGISDVTPHGLRHSFASLAYHLQIPEQIVMEIGGWSDIQTMRKIYTHIAQEDITRYQNKFSEFYQNAN